ncbi:MAG: heparinase II/III family protein [Bacilli bacterium]
MRRITKVLLASTLLATSIPLSNAQSYRVEAQGTTVGNTGVLLPDGIPSVVGKPWIFETSTSGVDPNTIAKHLMDGKIYVRKEFAPVEYTDPIDWTMNPYNNNSWQAYFHSLNMVSFLAASYEKTGNRALLDKARYFVESWVNNNMPEENGKTMYAWYPGTVSNRVIALIHFWTEYRDAYPNDEQFKLWMTDVISAHGAFLADDENYRWDSNHGIFQNRSLLEIAFIFPDLPESRNWLIHSLERLQTHIARDLTVTGVHKEHSPGYHIVVRNMFSDISRFLKQFDIIHDELETALMLMDRYIASIADQTYRGPSLGDSFRDNISNLRYPRHPYLEYVTSKGKFGEAPPTELIDPYGGTAVFRNAWDTPDPLYTVFTTANFSTVHKHADDLSFILRYGKTDFLVDGGKYLYGNDPFRSYIRSSYAHNIVVVDDTPYSVSKAVGKTKMTNYGQNKDYSYVTGTHTIYPGVTMRRTLVYLKKYDSILVLDEGISSKKHVYTQVMNAGKDVEVQQISNQHVLLKSKIENRTIEMIQSGPIEDLFMVDGGSTPIRGWQSVEFAKIVPLTQMQFSLYGERRDFQTIINLNPDKGLAGYSVRKLMSGYTFTLRDKGGNTEQIRFQVAKPQVLPPVTPPVTPEKPPTIIESKE